MSYVYGKRIKAKETELVKQLRQELYTEPYESINWYSCRSNVAAIDLYTPHTTVLEIAYKFLSILEYWKPAFVRKMAVDYIGSVVKAEDEITKCISIGPVSLFSSFSSLSLSLFLLLHKSHLQSFQN